MANDDRLAAVTKAARQLATSLAEAASTETTKGKTGEVGKNVISVEQGFKDRDYFSGKLSEITRQLGLAGIAIIWVFRTVQGSQQTIPLRLIIPGFVLVLGLTFDFLQYLVANALLELYTTRAHKAGKDEFIAPSWMNTPNRVFFYSKIWLIAIAYLYLLVFLALKLILGFV